MVNGMVPLFRTSLICDAEKEDAKFCLPKLLLPKAPTYTSKEMQLEDKQWYQKKADSQASKIVRPVKCCQ